jgi:hypothetical protein
MSCRCTQTVLRHGAWTLLVSLGVARGEPPIVLRDVTAPSGIAFRHTDGSSGRYYLIESVASGLATFDYDGDGWVDIYFLNGCALPGAVPDPQATNALYRNLGGFRFVDVTASAGVGDTGYGLGVTVGDYNNDGHPDLYCNNFGPNVLYRNSGDGTFADVTRQTGTVRGETAGAGANFLDTNGDGALDLFVANYVRFSFEGHHPRFVMGLPRYPAPRFHPLQPNVLYRNDGAGTFTDVSQESGIANHAGAGMGTVCLDGDNDGDTDIFVCNDTTDDFLFANDGTGRFDEVGMFAGVAVNTSGLPMGSMGADSGDYDRDGWMDLFVTDYQGEPPALYRNLGDGLWEDVATRVRADGGSFPYVKWGSGFVDFDNDGDKDIFFACGHTEDNIEQTDRRTSYACHPVLLRNTGDGRFVNVSTVSGDGLKLKIVGRGVCFDDLDNDGRVDVVMQNARGPAVVLRNESDTGNHWLMLLLRGVPTNRDGVGARVQVVAGDLVQVDEVHSGRSYQSHFGSRLHFGLGPREKVDRIEVQWLGGGREVFEQVSVDRLTVLTEGTGVLP